MAQDLLHEGRGCGRPLLAHAERLAVAGARPEIRLLTNAAFAANVQLYQRVGYSIARSEPFMGGTTLHMHKTIPTSAGPMSAGSQASPERIVGSVMAMRSRRRDNGER